MIRSCLVVILSKRLHVTLCLAKSHPIQNSSRVEISLSKEPNILDTGIPRSLFHRCGKCSAVIVHQHLRERASTATAKAFAAEAILCDADLGVGIRLIAPSQVVASEIEVETLIKQVFFVQRLRQYQGQRVLEHCAVAVANHLYGSRGVDPFCCGDTHAGAAGSLQELPQWL